MVDIHRAMSIFVKARMSVMTSKLKLNPGSGDPGAKPVPSVE